MSADGLLRNVHEARRLEALGDVRACLRQAAGRRKTAFHTVNTVSNDYAEESRRGWTGKLEFLLRKTASKS
jgi:hypothetical protein